MFDWLKKQRTRLSCDELEQVKDYIMLYHRKPTQPSDPDIKYSRRRPHISLAREEEFLEIPHDLAQFMVGEGDPEFWYLTYPELGATFVQVLAKLIDESDMTSTQIYKKAQIDRRLYSKILSSLHEEPSKHYIPSKDTIISLALALELSLGEANALLYKAGYSFSDAIRRDLIIEYFFRNYIYDIDTLNDTLYRLGEKTLGRQAL